MRSERGDVAYPIMPETVLPDPPPDAVAAGQRVVTRLRAAIDHGSGAISFARYMDIALYAPGIGYYSAGSRKFGPEGDFITAPEVSPLFARCLARQCRQVLDRSGGSDILEFGPGSGILAAELLLELERLDCLPQHYYLLDLSADLRQRQHETLAARAPHLLARVVWLEALPQTPLQGVILANELLDALPVELFCLRGSTVVQRCVSSQREGFGWTERPAPTPLAEAVTRLQQDLDTPLPDGYRSEINLALPPWTASLSEILGRGAALLIDYGYPRREYYLPERSAGTLMCHYQHRAHPDPLILAGLQDITAHVDFTAVAEAAQAAGLEVAGYTTQAHFLMANGLLELAAAADAPDSRTQLAIAQQVKTLTLPGEMGERFKVLALTRGVDEVLQGFLLRDMRERL